MAMPGVIPNWVGSIREANHTTLELLAGDKGGYVTAYRDTT